MDYIDAAKAYKIYIPRCLSLRNVDLLKMHLTILLLCCKLAMVTTDNIKDNVQIGNFNIIKDKDEEIDNKIK